MRAWIAVGSFLAVGAALAFLAQVVRDGRGGPPIIIEDIAPDATIVVAVEGAVASPGVYGLPGRARLNDALAAAGGTTPDADLAALNPAQRLRDGERVVVPGRPASPQPGSASTAGPLNINTASADELDALPGIGAVLAQRIVEHRTAHGPFATVDDLVAVRGISGRMVDELRPFVTAGL